MNPENKFYANYQAALQILDTIKYKPNFKIELMPMTDNQATLRVTMGVVNIDTGAPDSIKLQETFDFRQYPIDTEDDQKRFTDLVFELVIKIERHEIQEHFKVNGRHWVEPHPELAGL